MMNLNKLETHKCITISGQGHYLYIYLAVWQDCAWVHSQGKHSRFKWQGWSNGAKSPMPNFWALKISRKENKWLYCTLRTMQLRYTDTSTNLLILLNGQKYPHLNQATQNNTCQILLPKKSQNQKFQTQNNPSIIPVTWNPEYPLGVHYFKVGPRGHPSPS